MKIPILLGVTALARRGRDALYFACPRVGRRLRRTLPGRFQAYSHTFADRYPWLFRFAAADLGDVARPRILSFGCSRGDEVFTLRDYFPDAEIRGIDVDPRNIARCRARAVRHAGLSFAIAADTVAEPAGAYDAIFCLGVLCLGDLAVSGARRSDPLLYFADFERIVVDLARCLKPGGRLFLHTTNFRFCDTAAAPHFDAVLEAQPWHMAPDPQFGRDNRRIHGARCREVAFRKR